MQLHSPDAVAIREQIIGPTGGQAQPTRLKQRRRRASLARQLSSCCRQTQQPAEHQSDELDGREHSSNTSDLSTLALAESNSSSSFLMQADDPLQQARAIAQSIEQLADQLRPDVIRAARADADGRRDLDRIEYALGTIGKALILTDYSIDEEKDIDKLKAFRESQKGMG